MTATAQITPAATVMLVRDAQPSPEVLMLVRNVKSEVFPNLSVFPGGRVDADDRRLAQRLTGVSAETAAAALPDLDPELAMSFFVAAIRETYEESGLVIARRRGESELVSAEVATELEPYRLSVQKHQRPFGELIEKWDLELAGDRLAVHARWVTPEPVKHRFDTLFLTAVAPAGQLAGHDGVEASSAAWLRPEDALRENQEKKRMIIFPTLCNLDTLSGHDSAEGILEASRERQIVKIQPTMKKVDGRNTVNIPEGIGYERTSELFNEGSAP